MMTIVSSSAISVQNVKSIPDHLVNIVINGKKYQLV